MLNRRDLVRGAVVFGAAGVVTRDVVAAETSVQAESMLLQIYFQIADDQIEAFEQMFRDTYVPALRKQEGYLRSNLLRLFPAEVASEIQAATTDFNYQIELVFDTEENRRKWVASSEHQAAWPQASGMANKVAWRGYDITHSDTMQHE